MRKIIITALIIFSIFFIFINLTPQKFTWGCNGNVGYAHPGGCQLLPPPPKQNLLNNSLLTLNILDFNQSNSDCLNGPVAILCFPFLEK